MAQLRGIFCSLTLISSCRRGAREEACVAGQTVTRRDTGLPHIFMLGCVLVATTVLGSKAEEVRRFDKNRDGKQDQWEYYQGSVLIRVEVDCNQDGPIDETTFSVDAPPSGRSVSIQVLYSQGDMMRAWGVGLT